MKRLLAALVFVAVVALALVLTTRSEAPETALPDLTATRLDDRTPYELTRLAGGDKPTLLWFWAPWCSVCNGEAAKIQQLAAEHGQELDVVAIGGRDEVDNAPVFVERHGFTAPQVLFDETMRIWEHYRIPGQPGAVLLDTDGIERGRWLGAFDTELAVTAAGEL
jgi:thiol-disulfide isomerase/thioredoxin